MSWFETDFKESAKSTTRTSRRDDGKVSYSFSVVNNSGYDFDRFAFRLKVVNKADGSELGSARINAGRWAAGEKKTFRSLLDIPSNVKSVSFVMASNAVEYETAMVGTVRTPARDISIEDPRESLSGAFREISDALTGADGSGGMFGELFGTGGMPETGGQTSASQRQTGSPGTGSRSGEIHTGTRPQQSSGQRQQTAQRRQYDRRNQQRTAPRQDYTTQTQSFTGRRNEKKLNKKRLGKSPGALTSAIFALLFAMTAAGSIDEPQVAATYLGLAGILGIVAVVLKLVNNSRGKMIRAYEQRVNKNGNTSLDELAEDMNKDVVKVADDLQKMIVDGFFGEAYIDLDNRLLVMTRNGVPIESPEQTAAANRKAQRKAARDKGKMPENIEDLILITDDPDIKARLKNLRTITKKIDQRAKDAPELEEQVSEFRDKFYPEVVRLTDEYNQKVADIGKYNLDKPEADPDKPVIDAEPNYLEKQAQDIKKQLIDLIDSVTEASENMLENLHEGELMDISTDIKTLQTTLASKGLLDSDFDL